MKFGTIFQKSNLVRHGLTSAREVYFGLCWTSIAPFGKDPMLIFFLELSAHSSIQWYDNQIRIEIWLWPLSTNSSTRTKSSKVRFSFDPLKFCPCSRTVREGFIGLGEFGTRKVPNEFQTNESKVGNVEKPKKALAMRMKLPKKIIPIMNLLKAITKVIFLIPNISLSVTDRIRS